MHDGPPWRARNEFLIRIDAENAERILIRIDVEKENAERIFIRIEVEKEHAERIFNNIDEVNKCPQAQRFLFRNRSPYPGNTPTPEFP
jgi:hypothetical protein